MATDIRTLTRRTIIDMALRRQQPGSGSARAFLRQRTTTMKWPDLSAVLAPTRWAVVGAVATRLYMPERMTQDLDVAVVVEDAATVRKQLADAGFIKVSELSIGGSSWRSPDGQRVEVIEGREPWWPEALAEAQRNRDADGLPILPLPYLVFMKMKASRTVDLGDLARMLGQADEEALDRVRRFFQEYAPEDSADLESLIVLGRLEFQA